MPAVFYEESIFSIIIEDQTFDLIKIHNFDEIFDNVIKVEKENADDKIPYWVDLWPSAIALSHHLLKVRHMVAHKNVIEIGAGLGLPSLVASRLTETVTCSDFLQDALDFAARIAKLNQISTITYQLLDWRHPPIDQKYDVILASDVAYEKRFYPFLIETFHQLLDRGGKVLISEPNRKFTAAFLENFSQNGFDGIKTTMPIHHNDHTFLINIVELTKQ